MACKANGDGCMDETKVDGVTRINDHEFEFHNAHCFKIDIPQIGPAQAIYYDVAALKDCCKYIKEHRIKHPIVYIMACRIGPFAGHFYKEIHKLGGTVYLNPDGHEWMRAKWSAPIRKYWKISEQMMIKYCDLAICDSVNIEKYIHECYDGKGIKCRNPKTTFIAYGADLTLSTLADDDEKLVNWYKEKGLTKKDYYLVVGRFVPENSFEVMIREFMKSKSKKNFAIITNVNEKFLNELEEKLHFKSDKRIKFVGTVYDQELLKKIRENAYAYFHGHTVGGTNPSLIEALGSTDLNLLVDVGFCCPRCKTPIVNILFMEQEGEYQTRIDVMQQCFCSQKKVYTDYYDLSVYNNYIALIDKFDNEIAAMQESGDIMMYQQLIIQEDFTVANYLSNFRNNRMGLPIIHAVGVKTWEWFDKHDGKWIYKIIWKERGTEGYIYDEYEIFDENFLL